MRHTPTQATLPPSILSQNFLQSISPSQSASPSVAQYSAGLAHDARNMLAAMDIYCELLASPGVLKPDDQHLLDELRLLRDSSGKLLDRLLVEALRCLASSDQSQNPNQHQPRARNAGAHSPAQEMSASLVPSAVLYDPADAFATTGHAKGRIDRSFDDTALRASAFTREAELPSPVADHSSLEHSPSMREGGKRVKNIAAELQVNLPMLSALAGPRVHVTLETSKCPEGELFMPPVDLTRVLINLVRNAAEAMSIGGRILIAATAATLPGSPLSGNPAAPSGLPSELFETSPAVLISIEDNGPGIPLSLLDRIFDLQVSSATQEESMKPRMQFRPRGLGLRIVRDFVEAGGGSVRALRLPDRGSRFEVVLPMVTVKVTQIGRDI